MAQKAGYEHADAFDSGFLQVSDLHRVYYAQYGKPNGKPVIFLHGGPGGGTTKGNTTFFDPAVFRVVLMDQRGAGQSTPLAEVRENTTQLLIQDIETLREHCGIKKWHMVFGGSWGSTLSLAYSQTHPSVCGSLVLRGVFLGTREELDLALTGKLTGMIWPEEYDRFLSYLPEDKRHDTLSAYHELIMQDDQEKAFEAAKVWSGWEMGASFLERNEAVMEFLNNEKFIMSHARLEVHYFINNLFLEPDQLLKGCEKIKHIPTRIVNGRYDILCLPRYAWSVHKALPLSKISFSPVAGHAATEPGTLKLLVEACDELGQQDFHVE